MTLFRGDSYAHFVNARLGLSWTTHLKVAQMFASGLNCVRPDGGVVVRAHCPADGIIKIPCKHSLYLGEHEYVVDVECLQEISVLERYDF